MSHELRKLLFEVADSGTGIAPEEIDNIFDAFVRTQTGRDAKQGTGLGLTLSRKFVQMMGGDREKYTYPCTNSK